MATPITHVFFADKFWNKHQEIDKYPFFAWNCLPDIRYIDEKIERTKFHISNVSINDILEEKSDFWKGVKFHSFVDENRDLFYEKHNIYIPKISDWVLIYTLKILEDDIIYWELPFRQDFIKFFQWYEFPTEDISKESIKKWKEILCNYFSSQPDSKSRKDFILWVWLSEDLYIQIENMLGELRWKYNQKINDMISFLEKIM